MKRFIIIIVAALALATAGVAGAAVTGAWASCTGFGCVNQHLNSVHALALKADTRALTPGPRGATGNQGLTGNQGDPGVPGPAGQFSNVQIVQGIQAAWTVPACTGLTCGPVTSTVTARADCPAGTRVTGGGFMPWFGPQAGEILASAPILNGNGWYGKAYITSSDYGYTYVFQAYAMCGS